MLTLLMAMLLAPGGGAPSVQHPAHRARGNIAQYFSVDDYPPAAARRGIEGTVGFRFHVDTHGRVTECKVTQSANDPALDAATCAILLARAQLEPARDARGRPVEDTVVARVTWRLQDDTTDEWTPPPVLLTTRLESNGGQTVCHLALNGADTGPVDDGCGPLADQLARWASVSQAGPNVLSLFVSFEIDGAPAMAPDLADAGDLLLDATARFSVARDGHLNDCHATHFETHGRFAGIEGSGPDLCGLPDVAHVDLADPNGAEVRSGTIHLALYLHAAAPARHH